MLGKDPSSLIGVHLIYKQAHLEAVQPDFLDVAQSIEMRWREEARIAARRLAAEKILQQYKVVMGSDLRGFRALMKTLAFVLIAVVALWRVSQRT